MLAQLHVGGLIEHGPTAGAATERHWIALFERYLPKRYRASSAFVIDSRGNRSRQIDIAIFDHFYSPLLFPQESAVHIPAESVYAVFEVKPSMSRPLVRDAAAKVVSVRALHRTSAAVISAGKRCPAVRPNRILGGLLAATSVWGEATFAANITPGVAEHKKHEQLDWSAAWSTGHWSIRAGCDVQTSAGGVADLLYLAAAGAAARDGDRAGSGLGRSTGGRCDRSGTVLPHVTPANERLR